MKSFCAILILCITPLFLSGQDTDDRQTIEDALTQYETLANDPQLLLLERSLQKSEEKLGEIDTTTTKVYNTLAEWHAKNNNHKEALDFSLKHFSSLKELDSSAEQLAKAATSVGSKYTLLYNFIEAERYFVMSMDIIEDYRHSLNYNNYKGLARVLLSKGDYNHLISHSKHAYELAETADQQCEALHLELNAYARMDDIKEANNTLSKILQIAEKDNLLYQIGRAYSHQGWLNYIKANKNQKSKTELAELLYREAIYFYEQSIEYMRKSQDYRTASPIVWAYTNISNQYRRLNKPDLAIEYAKKAVEEHGKITGAAYSPAYAFTYYNLATKYTWQKDFESAIRHQQNAIKCLLGDETFSDSRASIPKGKLYKVGIKWRLLNSLKEKAISYAHLFLEHGNKEDAVSAERHLATAVTLIDIMREELTTDDTKIFWRSRTKSIYDTAIEVSVWLKDKEKVLKYMEKSRSLLLLDELNHKDAMSLMPEELAKREFVLRQAYTASEDESIERLETYMTFLDSIKSVFPSYYKYKFDNKAPSISDVQKSILDDSTQVINYQITPDSLFILNITSTGSELITSPNPKSLRKEIPQLLTFLNNKDSLEYETHFQDFIKLSHNLYNQLYGGITERRKNVIIVGDGMINYIPFDVLVSDKAEPRYLIQDYVISSVPSLTILQKVEDSRTFDNLLLVSPEEFEKLGLQELKQSAEEQKALESISNTKLLSYQEATFDKFAEISDEHDVIHLTTHSGLDKETNTPWIAFWDSVITQDEIYKMRLNASLVTLSSCKSIDGESLTGEGINSLARAFLFADAAAVIGSSWNLNEAAGLEVMKEFYNSLKSESDKSLALRKAKLSYIEKHPYKSPYYWAPLVLIGDPKGLEVTTQKSNLPIIALAVLGLIGFLFLLRNFTNQEAAI